jgi:hypothetical protein
MRSISSSCVIREASRTADQAGAVSWPRHRSRSPKSFAATTLAGLVVRSRWSDSPERARADAAVAQGK